MFGLDNNYGFTYVEDLPGFFTGASVYDGSNNLLGFNALSELNLGYDGTEPDPFDVEAALHLDAHNGKFLSASAVANAQVTSAATATQVYELSQDTPTLVTVTIFVEGWASGATNNIIASSFNISWKFSLYIA